MNTRLRNTILAAIGLLSLAVYVLACRASFSPDGKKVIFPYLHPEPRQIGVALHDREKGTTRSIFAVSSVDDDGPILTARWSTDGKQAIILWPDQEGNDSLMVLVLPIEPGGASRLFRLSPENDPTLSCVMPPPCIGHHLFIGGEAVRRLDLRTGEIRVGGPVKERGITGEGLFLVGRESSVFYLGKKEAGDDEFEVGTVDGKTLELKGLFSFNEEETGVPNFFLAVSPDASRLALTTEEDAARNIVIFEKGKMQAKIRLSSDGKELEVGNVLWSADSKRLFVAAARRAAGGDSWSFGILEVPTDGGEQREISLLQLDRTPEQEGEGSIEMDEDAYLLFFQLALSPDGKSLAASSAYFEAPEKDRALFLVDLTDPGRTVEKVPLPGPTPPDEVRKK